MKVTRIILTADQELPPHLTDFLAAQLISFAATTVEPFGAGVVLTTENVEVEEIPDAADSEE